MADDKVEIYTSNYLPMFGEAVVLMAYGVREGGHMDGRVHTILADHDCLCVSRKRRAKLDNLQQLRELGVGNPMRTILSNDARVDIKREYKDFLAENEIPVQWGSWDLELTEGDYGALLPLILGAGCRDELEEVRDNTPFRDLRSLLKAVLSIRLQADKPISRRE